MRDIRKTLLHYARQLGRWLLVRYLDYGRQKLVHYMEGRVDVFRARLERARSDRRKRWLRGRIRRWTKVTLWLQNEGARLTQKLVREMAEQFRAAGGPEVAPLETFAGWTKAQVRRGKRRTERAAKRETRRKRRSRGTDRK